MTARLWLTPAEWGERYGFSAEQVRRMIRCRKFDTRYLRNFGTERRPLWRIRADADQQLQPAA